MNKYCFMVSLWSQCRLGGRMEKRGSYIRTLKTDRLRMVWMWLEGKSARAISLETGISICTVYRWIRRWREEGNVDIRPYRGKYRCNAMSPLLLTSYSSQLIKHFLDTHYTLAPMYHFKPSTWPHSHWDYDIYTGREWF